MKRQEALKRLEHLIDSNFPSIEHNSIIPIDDEYLVFGHYRISGKQVYKHTTEIGEFSSQKVALCWCIADKYQQHRLAQDILHLEHLVTSMSADLKVRSHLAQHLRNPVYRENVQIKLERKRSQLREVQERLDKCVNLAKYLQIRGFNNETARTGRTASHRTSR